VLLSTHRTKGVYMMESRAGIKVKFLGPTNYRGMRLVVSRERWDNNPAERLIVSWDYGLGTLDNVEAAANAFLDKFVNLDRIKGDRNKGARARIAVCFDGDHYVSWGWVDDEGEWV